MLRHFILLLITCTLRTVAQTSKVVCNSQWSWASNSLGQNPCIMAAYARAVCSGNTDVGGLDPGTFYIGPPKTSDSDKCWCSSVTYSLLSACQLCQGEMGMRTWEEWITNCQTADRTNGGYPKDIPAGTAFPAWTFQVFSPDQRFSSIDAENIASTNKTEATRPSSAPSSDIPSATLPSGSNSPIPTEGSNPPDQGGRSSKASTGAIAGGVVGGIVGLALIALAAFFLLRRRKRSRSAPSTPYGDKHPELESTPFVSSHTRRDQTGALRYYDPSDPSTYPAPPTPAPGLSHTVPTESSYPISQNTRTSFSGPVVPQL